jgi:transposase-like protein
MAERLALDDHALQTVAALVTESLRHELQALSGALRQASASPTLTVEQVALRLGVSRSTVYAHWREWGGYKLGASERAPIRFDASRLPHHDRAPADGRVQRANAPRRHRRRRLIADAPRMPRPPHDAS